MSSNIGWAALAGASSGIYFEGESVTVENNAISDVSAGIWLNPSRYPAASHAPIITGNTISSPKDLGFAVGMYLPGTNTGTLIGGAGADRNTIDFTGGSTTDERYGVYISWVTGTAVVENNLILSEGNGTGILAL